MRKLKINRGYVLVSTLVIMAVMLVITYFLADTLFSELAIARNQKAATTAFHLAEAGVQEAIWRVQFNPATRNPFISTADGVTTIPHDDPALLTGGSYTVTIKNTAIKVATITSVGIYKIGIKTTRREIKLNIAEAEQPPPYDDDGAFFSHSAGGESTGDLEFSSATVNVYGGSIHSGRDISFKASTINVEAGIRAERNIKNQQNSTINCNCSLTGGSPACSSNPGCSYTYLPAMDMPMIDFDSDSPNSYKNQAIAQNQYYTSSANFFTQTSFSAGQTKTFNGVIYIEGGITIDQNRTMNMNGVLASSGSISIGGSGSGSPFNGVLNITRANPDAPAGALAQSGFSVNSKGDLSGTGLVYAGFRTDFNNSSSPLTFTGGFLTRRMYFNARTLNIYFDADVINDTLANPTATPIIEINHWEEEY